MVRLGQTCAPGLLRRDVVTRELADAYALTFPEGAKRQQLLLDGAWKAMEQSKSEAAARHREVARDSNLVAWPLMSAEANMVAAYARMACKEAYERQNFSCSLLKGERDLSAWPDAWPKVDFHFWVEFGSWSQCYSCRSFFFNDDYFTRTVYQDQTASATPNLLAAHRTVLPDDPIEHAPGLVGNSNRWWYLPGMYKPISRCAHCARLGVDAPSQKRSMCKGKLLFHRMAKASARASAKGSGKQRRTTRVAQPVPAAAPKAIERTSEVYKAPLVSPAGELVPEECCTWLIYYNGSYMLDSGIRGGSMLDLSLAEIKALRVVELKTKKQQEKWPGPSGHYNWTKIGASAVLQHFRL